MGKKKEEKDDLAADFFGDADWMDEEEEEEEEEEDDDSSEEAHLPVAPSPETTAEVAAPPKGAPTADAAAWENKISAAPSDPKALSNAPTLHFSSVPTLPPVEEADTDVQDAAEDMPTATMDLPPKVDALPTEEGPKTEETEVISEPPPGPPPPPEGAKTIDPGAPPVDEEPTVEPPAPTPETREDEAQPEAVGSEEEEEEEEDEAEEEGAAEFFGDGLPEDEPLVRTQDPAPPRSSVASSEGPAPSFGAPQSEPVAKWVPRGDEARWKEVAEALERASDATSGAEQAALLGAAARVHRSRRGDATAAEALSARAAAAAPDDLGMARARISAMRAVKRISEAAPLLVRASEQAEGVVAAELLLQAVEIARDVDPSHALDLARKATESSPEDYAAWSALRDLLAQTGAPLDERVAAAQKLAELSSGWAAAEALLEAAGALLGEERLADAARLLQDARAAAPDHGTVFVVLEDALGDLGDHEGLAALYTSEATREGTRDAGWWWLLAGRALQEAGKAGEADEAFGKAVENGYLFAERERQAAALRAADWEALASSLEREAAGAEGVAKAFLQYRLGEVLERRLDRAGDALDAYRAALVADPGAGPASDGVARLLALQGAFDKLGALWAARLEAASQEEQPAIELRLGEIAEAAGDQESAAGHFRKALGSATHAVELAAAEGLARVLYRQEKWAELGMHWATQATGYDDTRQKADLLFRAASVGARSDEQAADRLREVLALEPTHRGALFELCMRLEGQGDWAALAVTLDDAGDASEDSTWRAICKYRAALVRRERSVDTDRVRAGLEASVDADGTFQPAAWALRDAAADDADAQLSLYRGQAEAGTGAAAAWASVAASLLDVDDGRTDLRRILDEDPSHEGARAALECAALASGDRNTLVDLWQAALEGEPSTEKARLAVRLAAVLRDVGQGTAATHALSELAASEGERPIRAAARVAESLGAWDVAEGLLAELDGREDRLQRARILGRRKGDAAAALPLYQALLQDLPADPDVAFGAAITSARAGDYDTLAIAHEQMARSSSHPAARAASATWAATLHVLGGREAEALGCWQVALGLRSDSQQARDGAERALRALGDADGLVALFEGDHDVVGLADGLLDVGASERAVEVLTTAVGAGDLAAALYLEEALYTAEKWQELYDRLTTRREATTDTAEQGRIDARRRWILAEKLSDTDTAWELYKKLHEDAPDDREVTEALARIAGARGETGMAIQYLKELADSVSEGSEAARYQRRVGEVYERNGDPASARQAYLDALDHDNHDAEALDGLRRLARQEEDWPGLIQVHQREVGIAEPARVLTLKREIASITQKQLGQPAIAMDAWRSVLEAAPGDAEALEQLLALSEELSEWGSYVEFGNQLAEAATGAERTALLRKIGVVSLEQLNRDDAVRYFEQAISSATPDEEAARRLEELYRARGDWGGTIRALMVQSDIADTPSDKAAPLERAAKLELEVRHDRAAAAEYYQRVLDADPEHEPALRFMASHLFQTKRFDLARSVCDRLEPVVEEGQDLDDFDTRMDLASFYFAYAEMLFEEGRSDDALTRYERALELNPSHQASLQRVGPLYTADGKWKKAEQVYRQLLQLTGGQGDKEMIATIYAELGVVERELGNLDKAYKRFNKALELHPNHVGALKGMALVLEDRKDWSNLLNVFNNIIYHATVPADVVAAYMSKGRILDVHMERPDKAAQHYQRSLDFDPKQPEALLRMAELAMREGSWDDAKARAENALALPEALVEPHRVSLLLALAISLAESGSKDDAGVRLAEARDAGADDLVDVSLDDIPALRQLLAARI